MRDIVRKVITEDVVTLVKVAEHFKVNPVLIYRFVITEKICEHLRIGRSHVVIDIADMPIIKERLDRSKAITAARKAKA